MIPTNNKWLIFFSCVLRNFVTSVYILATATDKSMWWPGDGKHQSEREKSWKLCDYMNSTIFVIVKVLIRFNIESESEIEREGEKPWVRKIERKTERDTERERLKPGDTENIFGLCIISSFPFSTIKFKHGFLLIRTLVGPYMRIWMQ